MFKDDPNNKRWAEDKSRLGFKLLEKMGWKEGDGLGKNRDGMTEHVKVSLKTDNSGIGATEEAKKERTVCQKTNSFSEILSRLKTNQNEEKSSEGEDVAKKEEVKEVKQKTNRSHHHRRARSKMTSNYSSEDLAAILGKNPLKDSEEKKTKPEVKPSSTPSIIDPNLSTSTMSSSEYFAKKKSKKDDSSSSSSSSSESEDEKEKKEETKEKKKKKKD